MPSMIYPISDVLIRNNIEETEKYVNSKINEMP